MSATSCAGSEFSGVGNAAAVADNAGHAPVAIDRTLQRRVASWPGLSSAAVRRSSGFFRLLALPLALVAASGCAADGGSDDALAALGTPESLASPAGPNSGEPFLASAGDAVLLSWLEPASDSLVALRLARFDGTAWSEPQTIVQRPDFFVNWADFPSIISLPDGRLAAHWLQREGPGTYAYGVRIAFSDDDGATWGGAVSPHTDGTLTEHGFVSLFSTGEDGVHAVWLDGRNMSSEHGGHGGGDMTLRSARVLPDGTLADEAELDARTCECCQTDVAVTSRGPVAVYRDRSPGEIRDIAISRRVDGTWSDPAIVHADGWEIAGCPVNGPAVVADGERVAVAWFTAVGDVPQVNVAFSADAGVTFGAPTRVDGGNPSGRVDLLMLDGESVLVSWLERTGDGAAVRARRVGTDGSMAPTLDVAASGAERSSGFPRMARQGEHVIFAWTDPSPPAQVRIARVPLAGHR